MLRHHQPQAPAKTLPQTDLEMSRTAERSQGFHDLWPHTPKLNTGNTESRNGKNGRCLTRGNADKRSTGYQQSSAECRRIHSKAVLGGGRKGGWEDLRPQLQRLRLAVKA